MGTTPAFSAGPIPLITTVHGATKNNLIKVAVAKTGVRWHLYPGTVTHWTVKDLLNDLLFCVPFKFGLDCLGIMLPALARS